MLFLLLINPLFMSLTTVQGRIEQADGRTLTGAHILFEAAQHKGATLSGEMGTFTIELPRGTYNVTISYEGESTLLKGVIVSDSFLLLTVPPKAYEYMIVQSPTKSDTRTIHSPAAISILANDQIDRAPEHHIGALLGKLPGVNLARLSVRDTNIAVRRHTGALSRTTLALLDDRTIYMDIFGMVFWDFLPLNHAEIKRIELIRGPASAIWGANAFTGVVNIITRSPWELAGTRLSLKGGIFQRDVADVGMRPGSIAGIDLTHARPLSDRMAYKISLGYQLEDAWPRPQGSIPVDETRGSGGAIYPDFQNTDTKQPKISFRLDQKLPDGSRLIYEAGYAGTAGVIHTRSGPFDIQDNTSLSYGKINVHKGSLRIIFFSNVVAGRAHSLFLRDGKGQPIPFSIHTRTHDLEIRHAFQKRLHHFKFGSNIRYNDFDLSLAPLEDHRWEAGVYMEDEMTWEKVHFTLGGRIDSLDSIKHPIFSPRSSLLFYPTAHQVIRVSYNRSFLTPSFLDNFFQMKFLLTELDFNEFIPGLPAFPVIAEARGNQDLVESSLDAYELSYTIYFDSGFAGMSLYRHEEKNAYTSGIPENGYYSSDHPPPNWPYPPQFFDFLSLQDIHLPSTFTTVNAGPLSYEGLELFMEIQPHPIWQLLFNYSWQGASRIKRVETPFPSESLSIAPRHVANLEITLDMGRVHAGFTFRHQDKSYQADILDARYHGWLPAFQVINAGMGYRWQKQNLDITFKISNLANKTIQQHIAGDLQKRSFITELHYRF